MFQCESLVAVRGSVATPGTLPGWFVPLAAIGGTQIVSPNYPNPVSQLVVPMNTTGTTGKPSTSFRSLVPLGVAEGFFRVRAFTQWSVTVAALNPCALRLRAIARILARDGIEVVSSFDLPAGQPGPLQAGNAVAGPFDVFFDPIDPLGPVPFRTGVFFELVLQAEVTTASAVVENTTIEIGNAFPIGAGPATRVEIDTGTAGF